MLRYSLQPLYVLDGRRNYDSSGSRKGLAISSVPSAGAIIIIDGPRQTSRPRFLEYSFCASRDSWSSSCSINKEKERSHCTKFSYCVKFRSYHPIRGLIRSQTPSEFPQLDIFVKGSWRFRSLSVPLRPPANLRITLRSEYVAMR